MGGWIGRDLAESHAAMHQPEQYQRRRAAAVSVDRSRRAPTNTLPLSPFMRASSEHPPPPPHPHTTNLMPIWQCTNTRPPAVRAVVTKARNASKNCRRSALLLSSSAYLTY